MSNEKRESHPMDGVFAALETRVDGLSGRVRELAAENARLKAAIVETAAERDRLGKELEDARELAARHGGESAEKLKSYEAERSEVRSRIERLVRTLEEAEIAAATPA